MLAGFERQLGVAAEVDVRGDPKACKRMYASALALRSDAEQMECEGQRRGARLLPAHGDELGVEVVVVAHAGGHHTQRAYAHRVS